MNISLSTARKYADKIVAELQPYCHQVEIAGSIRRNCPMVGDINLVILPKDLAGLKARCKMTCVVKMDGYENFIVETPRGVQIDIFFARPESNDFFSPMPTNWGSLLLCRTGSKDHNIFLVEHAKKQGLRWSPYQGVFDKDLNLIASKTEEDIFKALGLDFIEPQLRER